MEETMTTTIDDIEFEVKYNYSAGRPGVRTLSNGDPGYPDDPDEVEILELRAVFDGNLSNQDIKIDFDKLPEHVQDRIIEEVSQYESETRAENIMMMYEREDD